MWRLHPMLDAVTARPRRRDTETNQCSCAPAAWGSEQVSDAHRNDGGDGRLGGRLRRVWPRAVGAPDGSQRNADRCPGGR